MAAQKIHSSTQKFTEIIDFVDNIVVQQNGNACLIIEVTASNFALLSRREQDSRIYAYAGLLNSLSFPIQILIRNKRVDITSYLKELDAIIQTTKNPQLGTYISYYRNFVQEMVTVNVVLNKAFYVIIPFSALEGGVSNAAQTLQKGQAQVKAFAETARKTLWVKAESLLGQLQKFSVSARILEREDLIRLFYDIYNEGAGLEVEQVVPGVEASIIKGGGQ